MSCPWREFIHSTLVPPRRHHPHLAFLPFFLLGRIISLQKSSYINPMVPLSTGELKWASHSSCLMISILCDMILPPGLRYETGRPALPRLQINYAFLPFLPGSTWLIPTVATTLIEWMDPGNLLQVGLWSSALRDDCRSASLWRGGWGRTICLNYRTFGLISKISVQRGQRNMQGFHG